MRSLLVPLVALLAACPLPPIAATEDGSAHADLSVPPVDAAVPSRCQMHLTGAITTDTPCLSVIIRDTQRQSWSLLITGTDDAAASSMEIAMTLPGTPATGEYRGADAQSAASTLKAADGTPYYQETMAPVLGDYDAIISDVFPGTNGPDTYDSDGQWQSTLIEVPQDGGVGTRMVTMNVTW